MELHDINENMIHPIYLLTQVRLKEDSKIKDTQKEACRQLAADFVTFYYGTENEEAIQAGAGSE